LLEHIRIATGATRRLWLAVAASACGFGIWATHFIAMLAFEPGLPSGYDLTLTGLSLIVAIVLTGIGFAVAVFADRPPLVWLGGAIVGGGIANMHYLGVGAYEIAGHIVWSAPLVAASVVLGVTIAALAVRTEFYGAKLRAALLVSGAIVALHFTGMAAMTIVPDPSVAVSATAVPAQWLAAAVAFAGFMVLLLASAALNLDIRAQRRAANEADRMRGLANAAVEGLLVCTETAALTANDSFAALSGRPVETIGQVKLSALFPDAAILGRLFGNTHELLETVLRHVDGDDIPVELIARAVDYPGARHAVAVRDLRPRKSSEANIRYLADHDSLTGLPNRRAFTRRLDSEISATVARGRCLALLSLDVDHFKQVNDLLGHARGDACLRTLAHCVGSVLDENQVLARVGGDEFAVIAPGLSDPTAAGRIAERILEALQRENAQSPTATRLSVSIGIAICPNDSGDREKLLSFADTALYRAKDDGRGTYRFFEATMGVQARERRQIEHDLRNALARNEMRLVYQPQVEVAGGRVVGFEALIRWEQSERGNISPGIFIPIAEETGGIMAIGAWTLQVACAEAAGWSGGQAVAVNVSAIQLQSSDFAQAVQQVLADTGLSPDRLELEITETAFIRDTDRALGTLRQLKAMGVKIAMDDFGTGYSSLSTLRAFPFDKIKIDQAMVRSVDTSPQAAAIVRAVLGLGRGLGLPVLAEGVETASEMAFLAAEKCHAVQGYLFGRPAAIETFAAIVHRPAEPSVWRGPLRVVAGG
jgi:diguanylate cyclase (GGDEF)-like protein